MSRKFYEIFPKTDFPVGNYRAVVLDCWGEEIKTGIVTIFIQMLIINHDTDARYYFCETIPDYSGNPRCEDFSKFIKENEIPFEQYEDITGMVFDAKIVYDQNQKDVFPIMCNRKLIAQPLK